MTISSEDVQAGVSDAVLTAISNSGQTFSDDIVDGVQAAVKSTLDNMWQSAWEALIQHGVEAAVTKYLADHGLPTDG